jgi:hypothetical protein
MPWILERPGTYPGADQNLSCQSDVKIFKDRMKLLLIHGLHGLAAAHQLSTAGFLYFNDIPTGFTFKCLSCFVGFDHF